MMMNNDRKAHRCTEECGIFEPCPFEPMPHPPNAPPRACPSILLNRWISLIVLNLIGWASILWLIFGWPWGGDA